MENQMKKFKFILPILSICFLTAVGQAQSTPKPIATDKDKSEAIPTDTFLKRGAPIGDSEKVSLAGVLESPDKYAGKMVRVEGVIVRSCQNEGCLAASSTRSLT